MKVAVTRAENSGFVLAARSPVGNCRKKRGSEKHFKLNMADSENWPTAGPTPFRRARSAQAKDERTTLKIKS